MREQNFGFLSPTAGSLILRCFAYGACQIALSSFKSRSISRAGALGQQRDFEEQMKQFFEGAR
ncbi:hypothetical protein [Acidocella aminolytica]|jgi:hypothetical protein|uniref:hypothetical protein n=1 Tax=Acidocella aminolytica TaxID=33998 RepID=UPI001115022A|nr:hypothetical protein [Acidocella aminolytica]